jgi:predicted NBD/HSP70 family sugar kinase
MNVLASEELGMARPPLLGMNDAEASALGEWVLHGQPAGRMFYVVMGTGIGGMLARMAG